MANLAHLFWLFAWLAFLVHAYWAVFIIFDGVADTFRQRGTFIAGVNFFLVGLWTLDVLLLWTLRRPPDWLRKMQLATRTFAFVVFAITLVALRGGAVAYSGLHSSPSSLLRSSCAPGHTCAPIAHSKPDRCGHEAAARRTETGGSDELR